SNLINHFCHRWNKGEQSTALATATDSTLEELYEWNTRYKQKFGFVFLIFASRRSTPEILAEMKRRYENRPIVEFELAAKEQMKITELRISKLFSTNATSASTTKIENAADNMKKAGGFHPVSNWLFPSLVFGLCWSMLYLVSSHFFKEFDPKAMFLS
ncbi:hypothetical protein RD792_015634, partial [Penstemon davidsonii]